MSNVDAILKELAAQDPALRKMGVRELALFGSSVRGEATADSDLDFLVVFDEKSFDAYMDLKFFLEDLFLRPVDLVLKDAIRPQLRHSIEESAIHAPGL